jgi:predicted nucleic acid-binding Zn ribbon protein
MDQYSCPYCTQQIPAHAKKCSYCHEWLAPGRWDLKNPNIHWTLVAIVALITSFGIEHYNEKSAQVTPKQALQQFVKGTSKIVVLSNKIIKNGKRLYIAGDLKNDESVNWDNVYVTANYFNKAGEKIDTSHDLIHMKAGEVKPFQIEFYYYDKSDHSLYDNYKVEVSAASNYGR